MGDKFSTITQRFRELIDNEKFSKVPRSEIAKATDCDTSTITKYYNGQRQLTVDSVIKFSKYFNVSSDYLLGLSNVPTSDKDLAYICEYTGLNINVVKKLNGYVNDIKLFDYYISFINNLLSYLSRIDYKISDYECDKEYIINHKPPIDIINIKDLSDEDFDEIMSQIPQEFYTDFELKKYLIFTAFNDFLNSSDAEPIIESWADFKQL